MNVSHRWITDLIPGMSTTPQRIADRLAMLGAPVDDVVDIGGQLGDIVIARVTAAEQHPNADRLRLCSVDAGTGGTLQVVCGAPNVRAGAYYPFAPVGASLPGGMVIRKAKIRGSASEGMLCSARELGLGRDHEGILELHGDFEPGRSFVESTGLDDARLVVDITPNRPDLLSHIGIAREIAAAEGLHMELPDLPGMPALEDLHPVVDPAQPFSVSSGGFSVRIDDAALCPHYIAVVIRNVRVGPSPEWLASRLRAIGLRPISNIVDATNYLLHELGHPMHAFDLDRLGNDVVVRRARAGERITTLDGADRALASDMLVIADSSRPVAVAGVMGGAATEVHDDTRSILLEIAVFDARSVRSTRRALALGSDASYRFERGVDPAGVAEAAARAARLIRAVAGGTVEVALSAGANIEQPPTVDLRLARVEQVLGVRFEPGTVSAYLRPLGFTVETLGDDVMRVGVPGHRRFDVAREEDLVEEIARRHGYDAFPDDLRPFRPSVVPTNPLFVLEDRLRNLLVGRGMLEARTAAFAPADDGDVELLLPLAATESRLRRSLVPGLLRRVESNFARGARSIRLFEIGTTFAAAGDGELPVETTRLAIACTGARTPPHWSGDATTFDVWDLKGIAAEVADVLGLSVEPGADAPYIEQGLSFRLAARHDQASGREPDALRGHAGRVREGGVDAPAWAEDVWVLEASLPAHGSERSGARYAGLPQHPAVERDLALLVGAEQPAAGIGQAIRDAAGALLESVEPFDIYSGRGVPDGMRSIAWRLRFRAPDRTLTDAEVDGVIRKVLTRLSEDLGVRQRA